jgi:hypothetical protein
VNKFPEFGAELKRDFEVSAGCYDCVEFYDGCNARRADPNSRCLDYFPLPPVGVNGKTGQETPPLRMGDRKEPRIRSATPKPDHAKPRGEATRRIGQSPKQPRQQSSAGNPGPDGERLCGCGARLRKRERCCGACRLQRRKDALERYQSLNRPSVAGGKA